MIDFGFDKILVIGTVALIVIGPEKLPRVARTVGTLMGKAQRYVADVKAEVNRSIELEELKKMKETVETAARDVQAAARDVESSWGGMDEGATAALQAPPSYPEYRHPKKKWRIKQGATPGWYKARNGIRTKALSGAARVARYRPHKFN